ncbi:MAG: membrane protein insertase YidC, partial [Luteimonas sp.]
MNQTRTFLILAWLIVATFLWMEWGKEKSAPDAVAPTAPPATMADAIPSMVPGAPDGSVPSATPAKPMMSATPASAAADRSATSDRIVVATDVLRLTLDGGNVFDAELLRFPQSKAPGSAPVKLFDGDPAHYYIAQSGWVGQNGADAPDHASDFVAENPQRTYALARGQNKLDVPFVWKDAQGVSIRRTFTFTRGSYAIAVRDEAVNASNRPWQGYVYRQLARIPPQAKSGVTNPESYSFAGATWYGNDQGYERRRYKDFAGGDALDRTVKGGWIALLQHHFFTAWIPQRDQQARFALKQSGAVDGINATGPSFTLAPGQQAVTTARLWVGPKLVDQIQAQGVTGLDRAVDYSRFSLFALLGQGLFWLLSKLHGLLGNWGWAIVVMVFLLKIVLFPLSAAQYKSAAKMRRFQPRIAQLKERYGDDKQKYQSAMMELYKKEKINPVGGCLPVLPQMII